MEADSTPLWAPRAQPQEAGVHPVSLPCLLRAAPGASSPLLRRNPPPPGSRAHQCTWNPKGLRPRSQVNLSSASPATPERAGTGAGWPRPRSLLRPAGQLPVRSPGVSPLRGQVRGVLTGSSQDPSGTHTRTEGSPSPWGGIGRGHMCFKARSPQGRTGT